MSGYLKSTDHGYDALLKRVFGFGRPQIAMGILAKDGAEPKTEHDGEAADEGQTVIEIAELLEFGTETAPARSIIRAWWDGASPEARDKLSRLMHAVVSGKRTKEEALNLLGLWAQGAIQKRMADGIDPPNAPSTIERKGSDKPDIDTGQVRSAISFEVREGDK